MKDWSFIELSKITNNLDNRRIPINSIQRAEKESQPLYPYIGANNIMGYIDEYLFDEKILCLAEDGGSWGSNEKCAVIYDEKVWVNNHAHVLTAKENLILEYLMYYLNYKDLNLYINGATRGKLTQAALNSIQIPLPPLSTQKKIAAILDAADAYRQKTKTLIDKYDQLAQSLFLDMFGDPVTNEKGWEKSATINYCSCIVPGRDKPKSFTGDIPWVTTSDLNHLGFTEKSISNIGLSKSEIAEVKAKIIPKGSVIMTCVGDLGIISINSNPVVVNQQLHAFQCFERLNNLFLMYNLSHQTPYMHKMASSTTVPYMNKTIANNTPTILPPIKLQNQFAERIQLIEAQKQQAHVSLQKAEDLFNSLLQRAFKGELVS